MQAKRTLLIGWDAADWKLIRPLLDSGALPALRSLMDRGVHGNLRTLRPILSPTLWTSIATGKRPYKHGILGFSEPDPHGETIRPVTNLSRRAKAIWNIFNQEGLRSNVIGWWPSHPAEPINGVMVSNHFPDPVKDPANWPMRPGTVHPAELAAYLEAYRLHPTEVNGDTLLPFVPRAREIDPGTDFRLGSLAKLIAETSSIHNAATATLQLNEWDFAAVYYVGIDHFGHGFMRYHPPKQEFVSQQDFDLYSGVMAGAYHFMDMLLGTLLQIAGEDCNLVLISDHGFHPDHLRLQNVPNAPAGPAAEHRDLGIFVAAGPDFAQSDQPIHSASLLDITPSLLHLYGLPVGEDMDGKVLLKAFREARPVASIPSWESVEGDSGCHPEDHRLDGRDAAESIQQLVELGYIEAPDADRSVAERETIRELDYNKAQSLMDGREFAQAREIAGQLWEQWPDESRFGLTLMQCELALGATGRLRPCYEKLVERSQAAALAARDALKAIAEADATKKAGGAESENELDPKEERRRRQLQRRANIDTRALSFYEARVLAAEGHFAEAKARLLRLMDTWPARQLSLYRELGVLCLKQRDTPAAADEAIEWLEKAQALDSEDFLTELHLARAYAAKDLDMQAAAHALACLKLQFFSPLAHFEYGRALLRIGHLKWGREALEEAVRQDPRMRKGHALLAWLFENKVVDPERAQRHRALAEGTPDMDTSHADAPLSNPEAKQRATGIERLSQQIGALPLLAGAPLKVPAEEMITVVTGLPRSGTSLAMQMLAAVGIEPLTDGKRAADTSNRNGYFEHDRVRRLATEEDRSWLKEARGRSIKIVVPLVKALPPELHYRIVVMDRAAEEIFQSQQSMLHALGQADSATRDNDGVATMLLRQFQDSWQVMARLPNCEIIRLNYNRLHANPDGELERLTDFLRLAANTKKDMAAVFSEKLYRTRKLR